MSQNPITIKDHCRLCGSANLQLGAKLEPMPIVSPNVAETGAIGSAGLNVVEAPLDIYVCGDCGLVQMIHVVDPSLIYRNYLYRTAVSKSLVVHFKEMAASISKTLGLATGDLVVEFGSNDGSLLGFFKDLGYAVQGVDPAEAIAADATSRGIPTIADFFTTDIAERIRAEKGPAKLIVSNNCVANIDDLAGIFTAVRTLIADDGVFVIETQNALDLFQSFLLDVIYHEHITYFSARPVAAAMPKYGLQLFDVELIPTKGGSVRFWIQPLGGPRTVSKRVADAIDAENTAGLYDLAFQRRFGERADQLRLDLHSKIAEAKAHGGKIAAFGTSVGCAALIHQFGLQDKLDFVFDDTPFKDRLIGAGYEIPVYHGTELEAHDPAIVIILAWRYADPIIAKQRAYLKAGGRFLIPLPTLTERVA